jgi:hypothetical protein
LFVKISGMVARCRIQRMWVAMVMKSKLPDEKVCDDESVVASPGGACAPRNPLCAP